MINTDLTLKHYPYPSIEQFRSVIYNVKHKTDYIGKDEQGEPIYQIKVKPTLSFVGTTKLHGTNAAVILDYDKDIVYYQSRENIITPAKDNAGFALYMSNFQDQFKDLFIQLYPNFNFDLENIVIAVYGEWCGGSIQKGVALNQLPKMFVIFDIAIINTRKENRIWLNKDFISLFRLPEYKVYNIYEFPYWTIDIDFQYPELAQNRLVELTTAVEEQCPVAHQLGVDGVGEGIVWKCITTGYEDSGFWMKVKGEKHASSKVKTLAPIDTEQVANIKEFVENTVTESRCIQSLSKLKEQGITLQKNCLGDYIRWIYNDIIKEEMDTIVANQLDTKKLGGPIGNKAREWFFKNELNFDNLV